jgi:hypothetical protein
MGALPAASADERGGGTNIGCDPVSSVRICNPLSHQHLSHSLRLVLSRSIYPSHCCERRTRSPGVAGAGATAIAAAAAPEIVADGGPASAEMPAAAKPRDSSDARGVSPVRGWVPPETGSGVGVTTAVGPAVSPPPRAGKLWGNAGPACAPKGTGAATAAAAAMGGVGV